MLQIIRERAQGVFAWIIVLVIITVFVLWGVERFSSSYSKNTHAVKVDGVNIHWRDVEHLAQLHQQRLAETNPQLLTQIGPERLKQLIQEQLINQVAFESQIEKVGLVIPDARVRAYIAKDSKFQDNGTFSLAKYKQFLQASGVNELTFEHKVRMELLANQLQDSFRLASWFLDSELKDLMELWGQKRDFGYAIIPVSKYQTNINITEPEITNYFNEHQQEFVIPEQVKFTYLMLTLEDLTKQIVITEDQARAYYQQHLATYTVPEAVYVRHILINAPIGSEIEKNGKARAKIANILAKIKAGANFAELAKQYSEDPISATKGGALGRIVRGQTETTFERAAFTLTQPLATSDIVQTKYGYHIIQLINRKSETIKPFAEVRNVVVGHYRKELAEASLLDKAEELANLAFEHPETLQIAAEKLNLTIKESNYLSKQATEAAANDIINLPPIVNAAFSDEVLMQSHNSNLIKLDDERYVVLRVIDHKREQLKTLVEARAEISEKLTQLVARDRAHKAGEAMLAKLIPNAPHVTWVHDISRDNTTIDPIVMQKVFALSSPKPKAFTNEIVELPSGDYAVIALTAVHPGTDYNDVKLRDQFQQELTAMLGQIDYQLFEKTLITKAKVVR